MPIEFKEGQAIVSLVGDVLVLTFNPADTDNSVAWMLLQEREAGEIGRKPEAKQVDDKICLGEQPGILLGAADPASIDVLINGLSLMRAQLMRAAKAVADGDPCPV